MRTQSHVTEITRPDSNIQRVFGVLPEWCHWLVTFFTICTSGCTIGTIGNEIGANGKTGHANGTNVTNQWYHWENPEHTQCPECPGRGNDLLNPSLLFLKVLLPL